MINRSIDFSVHHKVIVFIIMTAATLFLGLIPLMWATGTGADVMKRIAAPMIGGIFTSFLLELMVYPAIYVIWKWNFEVKQEG